MSVQKATHTEPHNHALPEALLFVTAAVLVLGGLWQQDQLAQPVLLAMLLTGLAAFGAALGIAVRRASAAE